MVKNGYGRLFASEAVRGEKIHAKINWAIYPGLFLLSLIAYTIQKNRVAGMAGMILSTVNLVYNGVLWFILSKGKSIRILSYITITLNIISITLYNYYDAVNNSPILTATSAAVLIYPIIMFVASLRMDRILVVYSTILCIGAMNGLYLRFHRLITNETELADLSADWLSQGYRTVYLIVIGILIFSVPRSMRRILDKQEKLIDEKTYHQKKAETDPLTSLYNRSYLDSYFEECRKMNEKHGTQFALIYIDINEFKMINDTYGHDCGDFVLISVGKDLLGTTREKDIVARIGGDELIVLFQIQPDTIKIEELAERVSRAIDVPRSFKEIRLDVKASIGAALYPDHADTLEALLKKADEAMYEIKKQKKHGIAYASG